MNKCRRVVVTGLGTVSPLGIGTKFAWNALINSRTGVNRLLDPQYDSLPCRIAAQVPRGNDPGQLNLDKKFTKSDLKSISLATAYSLVATDEALNDANWRPISESDRQDTGVAVGIGMIDLEDICNTYDAFKSGYTKVSPFFLPRILSNMAAGNISIKYGFKGPNHSVSTACATGAHALGDAFNFIRHGVANVMVCGGAEASIGVLGVAGFCRLRALSTMNDKPEEASRPFDRDRDGFVMGEGSAILVLEELKHAQERNAKIYCEVLGYGLSGDASHLTAPSNDGVGATLAMKRALNDAGVDLDRVTYVNAHATSTPKGDLIELNAIQSLFGQHSKNITVSSTKGAHGHLLGAAGNLEAAFTVLAIKNGIIPPTLNLNNLDFEGDLQFAPHKSKTWSSERRIALKNAFGFGGTNASLCFSQFFN